MIIINSSEFTIMNFCDINTILFKSLKCDIFNNMRILVLPGDKFFYYGSMRMYNVNTYNAMEHT